MILELIALSLFLIFLCVLRIFVKIAVYRMARKRKLFITVKEGECIAIMIGDKLDKMIMNMKGSHLDKDYNVVEGEPTDLEWITKVFPGVYWLGWPWVSKVYSYKFFWVKLNKNNEAEVRSEEVETIYVKDYQYVMLLVEAETRSMVPVSFPILTTVRVTNPYSALFKNDNWLGLVTSTVVARAKTFVASFDDPEEIIELSKPQGGISPDFGKTIFDLVANDPTSQETMLRVGARIIKLEVADIDYLSWGVLAIAKIKAEKEGDAAVMKAMKEAEAMLIKTRAEKTANRELIDELGEKYLLALRMMETLGSTNTNTVIDPDIFGSLKEILGNVSGKK